MCHRLPILLPILAILGCLVSTNTHASTILGTGAGSLLGGDLTDQDDVHVEALPPSANGFDANFFSSNEPGFGGGEFAYNVFDNAVGGGNAKWCCGVLPFPQIVGADFSTTLAVGDDLIQLERFTLTSSNDTAARDPQVWRIEGSTDTTTGLDGTWTTIFDHPTGPQDWTARNQVIAYGAVDGDVFLTSDGFKAFRLVTDATGSTSGAFHALNEIEFFGTVFTPAVPEPTSIAIWSLIGLGLAGFGWYRTRRKK